MDIQKKRKVSLRSFFSSLPLFLLVFLLAGCSYQGTNRALVEDDFRNVRADMTTKRIERKLGKPDRIIKDKEEIDDLRSEDLESSDSWSSEDPSIYTKFYGSEKKMKDYLVLGRKSGYDICYEYNYKYDKKQIDVDQWHIYFVDDKVAWMSFP